MVSPRRFRKRFLGLVKLRLSGLLVGGTSYSRSVVEKFPCHWQFGLVEESEKRSSRGKDEQRR